MAAVNGSRWTGSVRQLDSEHVDALAASIKLRGLVVAVIVRQVDEDYELGAAFQRPSGCDRGSRGVLTRPLTR